MREKRIMVVDDEAPIREMMHRAFTKAGYKVETAESAEKAIGLMKAHKPHVYFLDLNLPGINGIELCRHIRKDNPLTIAYAVTGYASIFEVFDCREAGFEDYFTKPVAIKTLLNAAEHAFQKIARWRGEDVSDE